MGLQGRESRSGKMTRGDDLDVLFRERRLNDFGHCHQEIDRLGKLGGLLEMESVVDLDLGFGSHDLFSIVLHPIGNIPIFDNVVYVIDTRTAQSELLISMVSQIARLINSRIAQYIDHP